MKITLIEPTRRAKGGALLKARSLVFAPVTLPLIAALTPPNHDVRIVNEALDDIDFSPGADIVGLTATTARICRAYEIADEYRRRGVYVVIGGVHASAMPDEALRHADTVFVGEADATWPQFLEDYADRNHKRVYRAVDRPSLDRLPVPQYSLLDPDRYLLWRTRGFARLLPLPIQCIQTARGCPHDCEYCSVTAFHGRRYRTRPVPQVVEEMSALNARGYFFLDDNIFASPVRARELLRAIVPLKISWMAQAPLDVANDRELIGLARESGCLILLLGIESISQGTLDAVGKRINRVADYERQLRVFEEEGISVFAAMMFGFEGEDLSIFPRTRDFLVRNRVAYSVWHPLLPLPGSRLYQRLKAEGKLKRDDWWLDPAMIADFTGRKFESETVDGNAFAREFTRHYRSLYSLPNMARRIFRPPRRRCLAKFLVNLVLRRRVRSGVSVLEN
jgi:radical SAM superfamily enzyme YgiQ (UPF0313 family)